MPSWHTSCFIYSNDYSIWGIYRSIVIYKREVTKMKKAKFWMLQIAMVAIVGLVLGSPVLAHDDDDDGFDDVMGSLVLAHDDDDDGFDDVKWHQKFEKKFAKKYDKLYDKLSDDDIEDDKYAKKYAKLESKYIKKLAKHDAKHHPYGDSGSVSDPVPDPVVDTGGCVGAAFDVFGDGSVCI